MTTTILKGACQCCVYPTAIEIYHVTPYWTVNTSTNNRGWNYRIYTRVRLSDGGLAISGWGSGAAMNPIYSATYTAPGYEQTVDGWASRGVHYMPDNVYKTAIYYSNPEKSGTLFLPTSRTELNYVWKPKGTNSGTSGHIDETNTQIIQETPQTVTGYWRGEAAVVPGQNCLQVDGEAGSADIETAETLLSIPLERLYEAQT